MGQQQSDEFLDEEEFDMAATRPPLLLGLPYTLSASLLFAGIMFFIIYDTGNVVKDLMADAVALGAIGMAWTAARLMLRSDYHGWDNFLAWCKLDFRCLDTKDWGGARLASLPLYSQFRCEAHGHAN